MIAQPEEMTFADDGRIPNNPDLPVLIYRGAAEPSGDLARHFEKLFAENGWTNSWRDGLYDFHHFHSTAHEVLGIARGQVRAKFGGEKGRIVELRPGDVVALPAGTGHKLEKASDDLLIVGAYADGRDWDIRKGDPGEREEVLANIVAVPVPRLDPVAGHNGLLPGLWGQEGG